MNEKLYLGIMFSLFIILGIASFTLGSQWKEKQYFIYSGTDDPENDYVNDVVFSNEVIDKLYLYYEASGDYEYHVCLFGTYDYDTETAYIDGVGDYTLGDETSVSYYPCEGREYIGDLHKHPNNDKRLSHTDLYTEWKNFNNYKHKIYVVQYDYYKINYRTRVNWLYGVDVDFNEEYN